METERQHLEKVEKSNWRMVLLAIVIILFLTLSLLGLQLYYFVEASKSISLTDGTYRFFVFLAIVILLFCSYMIAQHRRLSQLSAAFLKEQEAVQELSQDVKIYGSLLEVTSSISAQLKLSDILNTITNEILVCFEADHASVMLLYKNTKTIKTLVSAGKDSDLVKEAVIPMGESIAGYVIKKGEPMLLSGKVGSGKFPGATEKSRNITSSMCVPLKIGDDNIGVMNVNLVDRNRRFTEKDLKPMEIFASNAAVAINDARLYKKIISFNEKLEQKVSARTKELEAANRLKSNFLSSISHELRTPLNAIIGFSKVLLDQNFGPLNDRQGKYAQNIADSGQRLDAIIDNILDVSMLDAGDLKLDISPFKVRMIVEAGQAHFNEKAQNRKLNFQIRLPDDLATAKIAADIEKLRQVTENLVSNAVKFTPDDGAITVGVKRVSGSEFKGAGPWQAENKDFLEIFVMDTGIGIPPEEQSEVFKDFYQVKGSLSGKTSGTGMGLALAKRLVELHGGTIRVESEGSGNGSRFAFLIPFSINQ